MNKKIVWMLLSCLMVVVLLASCRPAAVEEEKGKEVVGKVVEKEEAIKKEAAAPVEKGAVMVRDSLGILKEKPRYGGWFRFCWTGAGALGSWDPASPIAGRTWHLGMYGTPTGADFTRGPSGTNEFGFTSGYFPEKFRIGDLAESWEQTDLQTIIIHFRKGVRYQNKPPVNGREMVAADYVYCVRRTQEHPRSLYYKKPGTPEEEYIRATTIDKYTVEVKLPKPDSRPWPSINFIIYPPELIQKYGDLEDWRNACGTGPWICTDYVPDSSLTYVKNPGFEEVDPFFPENRVPYIDGWTDINVPENTTALAALRTAKVDWWTGISWEDAEALWQSNPELKWSAAYQYYADTIEMRNDLEPFNDIRFRKALALAIDRKGMAQDLYKGKALVHCWPFRPDMGDIYTPLEKLPADIQELYEYNPKKAKQLLAEAGYPKGYKLELLAPSTAKAVDLAQIVKAYWDAIGVETTVKVLEVGTFWSCMYGWRYDQTAKAVWGNTNPFIMADVCYYANRLYNFSKVDDPHIIEVSELLHKTIDPGEHDRIFKELEPYVLRQCWNIILPLAYTYVFWQPWMKGYNGEWWGGFSYRWLDLDLRKKMTGS